MRLRKPLVLASESPRRMQILTEMGFEFEVKSASIEETYPPNMAPENIPVHLAQLKSKKVHSMTGDAIVIGADTIVVKQGKIFGKPNSEEVAAEMLRSLSDSEHEVITGVSILDNEKQIDFSVHTRIYFKKLSKEAIKYYVELYKPMDKAGAYAIQEWLGLTFIEKIEGDYYNVVGLPASRVYEELLKF
ncbi:MAG: septum formation protein Maf [Bacteroidetes bacterium]|nr:septum formation protein Maf [Bacteroidota bacterium]